MGKRLTEVTVKLPWVEGKWVVDDAQRSAAWEIYVELVTRVSVEPLGKDDGLLREALTSLYSLFGETRRILRVYGPGVAIPMKRKLLSLGQIAVDVLNVMLRPFLSKWHPLLRKHEDHHHPDVSDVEHERRWEQAAELRKELEALRVNLVHYADILAAACEVPSLHVRPKLEST
jgi:hypothetical protein